MKNRKEIFIATPMYNGMCTGAFTDSLIQTFQGLMSLGYSVKYCPLYNESLITRARNFLTKVFIKEGSDYLLFIDADQSFEYLDIHQMVLEDKDILSAIVPMKRINWDNIKQSIKKGEDDIEKHSGYFNINKLDDKPSDKVFEVKYAGTGMMLIKKEVFTNLENKVQKYINNSGDILTLKNGELISEFWKTDITKEGLLLSEDYNFCKIASEHGYKIFATSKPNIKHYGYYGFNGKYN
jgi:hypothetical protein